MRKSALCICENKDADQLRSNFAADQRFVFATSIVQSLSFLDPKFQACSHLRWLNSQVCVGPGRNPEDRFSSDEDHIAHGSMTRDSQRGLPHCIWCEISGGLIYNQITCHGYTFSFVLIFVFKGVSHTLQFKQ